MSKKRIIIMIAVGLISFAAMFAFSWFVRRPLESGALESEQRAAVVEETEPKLPQPQVSAMSEPVVSSVKAKKAMTEKQLEKLIYNVRESMQEYNGRLRSLELTEQRLQMAQDVLKKDIEKLNNLRIETASTVASLKKERDRLLESRLKIAKAEKENLLKIAATYDKMDASSASKILTNMSQMQSGDKGEDFGDAVKILHYMTERTKAKLLAELVSSEPKLAAVLCKRLKQVVEEE